MFANNPPVTTGRSDPQFLRHQEPEPGRIQVCPGAQHAMLRQPAEFPRHVRQDVDGVADDQQQRVRGVFYELGDDEFEYVGVALHEVQAGLALPLAGTGRNYAQAGTCRGLVICWKRNVY